MRRAYVGHLLSAWCQTQLALTLGTVPPKRRHSPCERGSSVPLTLAVSVFGPPAAGKTTLTVALGAHPGGAVFRLREHVPQTILAATATSAERLGWIDDFTVVTALRGYLDATVRAGEAHTLFFDNFPGNGTQVRLFLLALRQHAPECVVRAVELAADTTTLYRRATRRRVCHSCERDPIRDPRLPAEARADDAHACARCGGVLHPRRGDAPRLLRARLNRYRQTADGIRGAFQEAGVPAFQLNAASGASQIFEDITALLTSRSTP